MKIGIIQASSQSDKNELICDSVHKYAGDSEIVNFGCFRDDIEKYSYIEISILIVRSLRADPLISLLPVVLRGKE